MIQRERERENLCTHNVKAHLEELPFQIEVPIPLTLTYVHVSWEKNLLIENVTDGEVFK